MTYLFRLKLFILGEDCLVDVVILLSDASQSSRHFLVLFIAKLPRRDHIVGFEKGVLGYKAVLSTKVVVPNSKNASS